MVGGRHEEESSLAQLYTKADLLNCMPWSIPGGYSETYNTSAWEFRINICLMPSHCSTSCSSAVSLKLLHNISSTFLMSLIPPHGKTSFTSSCPPMYPPSFLICLVAKRQPMSQLREARVS